MFKKRNIDKKVNLAKDVEQIQVSVPRSQRPNNPQYNPNHQQIEEKADNTEQPKPTARYGLIEKAVQAQEEPKREQDAILKLYIQMRMEEINSKKEKEAFDSTTSEILQMQKQYLSAGQNKITQYDLKEVQKKLEKMATESIKNQLQYRGRYMVELLQNEHERMEYASKKELKNIKQERQRLEKQISSKYAPQGRRHYIEYLRQENLKSLK